MRPPCEWSTPSTSGTPAFSFEFFPPQDARGRREPLRDDRGAARRSRRLRLGHLRRGRLDARADARARRRASSARPGIEAMAHLTCVGATRDELRAIARPAARRRASRTCWPCAATRPGARRRSRPPPRRPRLRERARRAAREAASTSASAAPATRRGTSRRADLAPTSRNLAPQGRRRRRVPGHPALLRQRRLLRVRGAGAGGGHRRADRARASCRSRTSSRSSASRRCAARRSRATCAAASTLRRDDPQAVIDLGVAYATVQCADLLAPRRAGHPLLHAQPLARDARHPLGAAHRPGPGRSRPLAYGRSGGVLGARS